MEFLREEMTEALALYSKLQNTITVEEAKKLQPHLKAVVMLLREFDIAHKIKSTEKRMDAMEMYITGTLEKLED